MSQPTPSRLAFWLSTLFVAVACSSGSHAGYDELGSATITLSQAPPDVECLEVSAEGSRAVVREFDVVPGQTTVVVMNGLPTGMINFSARAFDASCSSIGSLPPSWISDVATVELLPGVLASVKLRMRRNGLASVIIDFEVDECLAAMQACNVGSECCSNSCVNNRCCAAQGSQCTEDSLCCSGSCDLTTLMCTPSCRVAEQMCDSVADCCSGLLCVSGVCTPETSCRPDGIVCGTAADCCSGFCTSGVCMPAP